MIYLTSKCIELEDILKSLGYKTRIYSKEKRLNYIFIIHRDELKELSMISKFTVLYDEDDSFNEIISKKNILGVIEPNNSKERIKFIISRIKMALNLYRENRKYKTEIKKRKQELATIHEFEESVKTTFVVEELLKMIVDIVTKVVRCQRASVLLLREEGKDILVKGKIGRDGKSVENFTVKYRGKVTKEIIKRRGSLLLKDMSNISWKNKSNYKSSSFLSVPILVDNEVSAVINVTDKNDRSNFTENDKRLLEILSAQVATTVEKFKLSSELVEKERMDRELKIAREIQVNLLPKSMPTESDIEIEFFYDPAYTVGGDYYDFIRTYDNKDVVFIGDVSGKGVPASLLMVMIRSVIHYAAQFDRITDPDEFLKTLNRFLYIHSMPAMFATSFMGVLDKSKNSLVFCNAGHNYPLLLSNGKIKGLETGDIILGMFDDISYRYRQTHFGGDDLLIMYTDGINESYNPENEFFGTERIINFFKENYSRKSNLRTLVSNFKSYFKNFLNGNAPNDDATLILIRPK